jgi:hypothetical protein
VECSDISEARREMNRHTSADCPSGLSLLYAGENPIDCRKWSTPGMAATVIFDNAGGITVQLSNGSLVWAHWYDGSSDSIWNAASDVKKALWECEFAYYDGHEPEADALRPTSEEIRNGGYRVERFENFSQFEDFCYSDHCESWKNVELFCSYVESGSL